MKYCPTCERILELHRFSYEAKQKGKLKRYCRKCSAIWWKLRNRNGYACTKDVKAYNRMLNSNRYALNSYCEGHEGYFIMIDYGSGLKVRFTNIELERLEEVKKKQIYKHI